MKKIFAIAGKACAGKDTLIKKLTKELDYKVALSFTTRPRRDGETQGVEYNFISDKDFWKLYYSKKLAEFTSYEVANGETWYYGLTKEELEKDEYVLVIVNPDGARQLRKIYGSKLEIIYITANNKERIKRYLDRDTSDNIAECYRRFLADEEDFEDFEYDYKVDNTIFDEAYYNLITYIRIKSANEILKNVQEQFKKNPMKFLGGNNG